MEGILGRQTDYVLTARRNNSLTSSHRLLAFCLIASLSSVIAIVFAYLGAWPILPFAGVEVALLAWAFQYCERHAADFERLRISGDALEIEIVETGTLRQFRFNRWWAQVFCTRDGSTLALRSHGRQVEFGRHMTREQRRQAAGALKLQLGGR